jgi:hypothetical protein
METLSLLAGFFPVIVYDYCLYKRSVQPGIGLIRLQKSAIITAVMAFVFFCLMLVGGVNSLHCSILTNFLCKENEQFADGGLALFLHFSILMNFLCFIYYSIFKMRFCRIQVQIQTYQALLMSLCCSLGCTILLVLALGF